MTEQQFWQLVTRASLSQSDTEITAQLQARLAPLSDQQLAAFDKHFAIQMRRSYRWSLWGAAYVMTGLDTEFPLIVQYPYPFLQEYDLMAGQLYENRTGHELPFVSSGQSSPTGKKFDDRPKSLNKTYPQLGARFPF